jgi:hypothetical protein
LVNQYEPFIWKSTRACGGRLLLGCESALDGVHLRVADLEGLSQDVGRHRWRGAKERHGDGLSSLKLAIEGGDDCGGAIAPVLLEVHVSPGKDEDVPLRDGLAEELVGSSDESNLECALEDEDDLSGARVRVRRVLATRGEVDARDGDAQRVHARETLHVGRRHHRPRRVVGVSGVPETREEEVIRCHVRLARESIDLDRCTHRSAEFQ